MVASAGGRGSLHQQAELGADLVGSRDDAGDDGVGEDHVPRLAGVRDISQRLLPGALVDDPLIVIGGPVEARLEAAVGAVGAVRRQLRLRQRIPPRLEVPATSVATVLAASDAGRCERMRRAL